MNMGSPVCPFCGTVPALACAILASYLDEACFVYVSVAMVSTPEYLFDICGTLSCPTTSETAHLVLNLLYRHIFMVVQKIQI